jgi:hypothetical protein
VTALTRTAGLAQVTTDTAAYVLNLPRIEEQQSPYVFEGSAFAIWQLIDGTRTHDQIVDELVEASGVEREIVARDTRAFLATLRGLGLIEGPDQAPQN